MNICKYEIYVKPRNHYLTRSVSVSLLTYYSKTNRTRIKHISYLQSLMGVNCGLRVCWICRGDFYHCSGKGVEQGAMQGPAEGVLQGAMQGPTEGASQGRFA